MFLGLLACACWCAGCGRRCLPTGSVSGRVTYNGRPLTTGVITFVNEKAGSGASGELDSSGSYRIALIRPGEYDVALYGRPLRPESPVQNQSVMKLSIPHKYQDVRTSGLTATVKEGRNTADFGI